MESSSEYNATRLAEAEGLFMQDADQLYRQMAEFEHKEGFAGDALAWGMERFTIVTARTKATICSNDIIQNIWNNERVARRGELLCLIADIVLGLMAGVAGLIVAALIVKEGLDALCRADWGESE